MARLPDLMQVAAEHNIKIGTIADLIHYRAAHERLIERSAEREIETVFGTMRLIAYRDHIAQETHLVLIKGQPEQSDEVLVRVHEPLSMIDLLDSSHQSHSWNLLQAMRTISTAACGVIVLINHDEDGLGLTDRILRADQKLVLNQELRNYGTGSQILLDLGVKKMRLMAAPRKMPSMDGFGFEITGYLSAEEAHA
jgi:3,4-dihydroxy 2-butanone 4-phosphate synthase/GTP cyclohydrolase II